MQPISSLPAQLKPRERLLSLNGQGLSLQELIAVIIGTGGSCLNVLEVAQRAAALLANGVRSVFELEEIPGLGQAKALRIMAALQLWGVLEQSIGSVALRDPLSIYQAMEDTLHFPQEHLAVFYLTVRQTKLRREFVSIGTLSASLIHPREVYRPAILNNAAFVILAHNHPSGSHDPSTADLHATRLIAESGHVLGIELLDHVVCASNGFTSLRTAHPELFS